MSFVESAHSLLGVIIIVSMLAINRLVLLLGISATVAQGIALYQQPMDGQPENSVATKTSFSFGNGIPFNFGGFHLVNEERVLRREPFRAALLRLKLRGLPLMKKSIAIGRAGFRPGKRSVDVYDF